MAYSHVESADAVFFKNKAYNCLEVAEMDLTFESYYGPEDFKAKVMLMYSDIPMVGDNWDPKVLITKGQLWYKVLEVGASILMT